LNYYEHHLGDYDGATAHLTWLEDCAYRRMLCLYYRTESPLPADLKQVCRLVRATSKPERDAVQQVLGEFFVLADDGWRNTRCDEDIAAYHELEPEREAKRENAKERQRRARQRRAELFESLRGHNIVPPYDTTTKALEALLSRVTDAPQVTAPVTPVTCDNTATHTHLPPPTSQIEEKKPSASGRGSRLPADWDPGQPGFAFATTLGLANGVVTAELDKFRDHWAAKTGKDATKADWQAAWRNWCRRSVEMRPPAHGGQHGGGAPFDASEVR
jgi:uncharacterized protein YdaU (DUF1376 family)